MGRYLSLAAVCWLLVSTSCFSRTWRSANGAHSVDADLVSRKGDSVVLKTSSGKTITVALRSLSAPDVKFVNRTMPKDAAEPGGSKEPSKPPVAGPPPPAKAGVERWQAGCDPGRIATSAGIQPISLTPFDRCTAAMIGRTHLLVELGGSQNARFVRYELSSGRKVGEAPHPPESTASRLIVNHDATLCACVPLGETRVVRVWSTATGEGIASIPLPSSSWGETLSFRGPMVTIHGEGAFMTYDVKANKVVARGEGFGHFSRWNWVSPGGTYAVCLANNPKRFTIVDTRSCVAAGTVNVPDLQSVVGTGVNTVVLDIAFTEDGQLMAALVQSSRKRRAIVTWDMRSGQIVGEPIGISDGRAFLGLNKIAKQLEWFPDKKKWLVLNREAIDVATGQTLWAPNSGCDPAHFVGDGRLLVQTTTISRHSTLSVMQLPISEIDQAQAKARAGEPFTPSSAPLTAVMKPPR